MATERSSEDLGKAARIIRTLGVDPAQVSELDLKAIARGTAVIEVMLRKYRKEKGILTQELARQVHEAILDLPSQTTGYDMLQWRLHTKENRAWSQLMGSLRSDQSKAVINVLKSFTASKRFAPLSTLTDPDRFNPQRQGLSQQETEFFRAAIQGVGLEE